MLSGYRQNDKFGKYNEGIFYEGNGKFYARISATSTTWMPPIEESNDIIATAHINMEDLFTPAKRKRFKRYVGEQALHPSVELRRIPDYGMPTQNDSVSKISGCYSIQRKPDQLLIFDSCSNPLRTGYFNLSDLDMPTPLWAYPAKLVMHPLAFVRDTILAPFNAAIGLAIIFFGKMG